MENKPYIGKEKEKEIIGNKYTIDSLLSEGIFGKIYKGFHVKTREPVAIKIDYGPHNMATVNHESRIINYLFHAGVRKIPEIYWFGYTNYSATGIRSPSLVMTLYECSLNDYMLRKTMTVEKLDIIFERILDIFEKVHKHFVLHRDIKPHNFMVKSGDIFLIDFGLSTFYMNDNGEHYPNRIEESIVGTPKFTSIHVLEGNRYSRRDDLISIGYMYIYMLLRQAPWEQQMISTDERIQNKKWENFGLFVESIGLIDEKIGYYIKRVYELNYMETTYYNL